MFRSVVIILVWTLVFLLGGTRGWSGVDIEDRFIDPDLDTSKTIFIDVQNASLLNVLKIISKQTGLSFIAAKDVEDQRITLYLNKIPLNQALHMVLDANDLTYEMQDQTDVFVVKHKFKTATTKITKVYQLKYATVSSSKLNSTLDSTGSGKSEGGLEQVLKDSLTSDGKVVEDPRTNSLIVTDVPGQFDIIDNTIARLDVAVPQILIEVVMLDVSKSTADNLGIQYGATPLSFTGGSKAENWPFGPAGGASSTTNSGGSTPSAGGSGSGSTSSGGFNTGGATMTAVLNFISSTTDAKTLARPRILTLNNETAQIEISTDQAISVENSTTSSTSSSSSISGNSVERYPTGVILKVTPQANLLTREVTMAVSPKVIDVIPSQVVETGTGSAPIFDPETRGSNSMLKLRDGQTMVIGGLLRNVDNKAISKLPFLGDLPLIGNVFRSTTTSRTERELVIFLTPHIIDDPGQAAFKGYSASIPAQAALDIQVADDRAQQINNSLNNYEMTKN